MTHKQTKIVFTTPNAILNKKALIDVCSTRIQLAPESSNVVDEADLLKKQQGIQTRSIVEGNS